MTAESIEMAAVIDRFPKDIRQRLRESLKRIAEIYVVSGVRADPPLDVAPAPPELP